MTLHEFSEDVVPVIQLIILVVGVTSLVLTWYQLRLCHKWNKLNAQHQMHANCGLDHHSAQLGKSPHLMLSGLNDDQDPNCPTLKRSENNKDLFPLYGVTLGITTVQDLSKLGTRTQSIYKKTGNPYKYFVINGMNFWFDDDNGLASSIYITYTDAMPEKWMQLGFDWKASYNQWICLLKGLGFFISIIISPRVVTYDEHDSFYGEIEATRDNIIIKLDFSYSKMTTTDSEGTLYSLDAKIA